MKELSPVPPDALAVDARDLRKEFVRKDRKRGKRRVAALDDVSFTMERGESVAILGQNGSGKSTLVRLLSTLLLPDGGSAHGSSATTSSREDARRAPARQPRLGRGVASSRRCRAAENLGYAARFYGMTLARDARQDPRDPRAGRLPARPPRRADGEPLARDAAEGRARAGAPHLAGAAPARRADDGARPALEARGAGVHPRDPSRRTTRRSCSARTTSPRPRRSPSASGSSTAGGCSRSSRRTSSRRATAPTRSRRRSSPRPAASSRTRRTTRTTTTGRCSHESHGARRCEPS